MAIVDYNPSVHFRGRWSHSPPPCGYPLKVCNCACCLMTSICRTLSEEAEALMRMSDEAVPYYPDVRDALYDAQISLANRELARRQKLDG